MDAQVPIIAVAGLTKVYGDGEVSATALLDVTFRVQPGEFVAIMGPSGSGKSTLLHILGLLDRQTSGTYRFDGRPTDAFAGDDLAAIRNATIGFVFQTFNLLPRTSVLENVLLPLRYSDVPEREWRDRARAAIARVGLTARERHHSNQLSGGEQQRVAIARAFVREPRVIFADEPTGNLDSASERTIMGILQQEHAEGRHTILLVTHELAVASWAQRILTFRDGALVRDEPVADRTRSDGAVK